MRHRSYLLRAELVFVVLVLTIQCSLCAHSGEERAAKPHKKSHVIALQGGLMHPAGFYFDAKVGGQFMKLQFDTSYSSVIVPRKDCIGCRVGDHRYNPLASSDATSVSCKDPRCEKATCSSILNCQSCSDEGACCTANNVACAFNMLYGDGSSGNGSLYYDVVEFSGLKAKVPLGAMREESHDFEHAYVDGTFGIAFEKGACHPGCVPPVMDYVRNQTGVTDMFTFCASRFGGTLSIGPPDESLVVEPFHFTPMSDLAHNTRFIVPALPHWAVGNVSVDLPGIAQAMISATTSSIAVGKDTMELLQAHFMMHYCDVPKLCSFMSWFKPHRCVHIEDVDFAKLPNITIPLASNVSLTITPDDYLPVYREVKGKTHRCVAFHIAKNLAQKGIGLVLGATVFRRYAAVFDRPNRRVGFALAKEGMCGPLNGSTVGFVGISGAGLSGNVPALTALTPPSKLTPGIMRNSSVGKDLLHAEECRMQRSCSSCARKSGCSFWYTTGRCVTYGQAGSALYPYCSGVLCACWTVGASGWYVGLGLGIIVALAIIIGGLLVYAKRQRRYRQLDQFDDEQDLDTF